MADETLIIVSNSKAANLPVVSGTKVKDAPRYLESLDKNSQRISVDVCEMGVGSGAIRDGVEKADYVLTLNDASNLKDIRGIACLMLEDGFLKVDSICAIKGARRGTRLMLAAEAIARGHGLSRITLESVEESVGFYQSLGFTPSEECKDELCPMEKTLPPAGGRRLRLKTLRKSHKKEKKWDAVFEKPDGSTKIVPFGQKGYSDYTKHKDKTRRQRYIDRHSGMGENWRDPATPGALSRYILWNKPTLKGSLRDFKKRFGV